MALDVIKLYISLLSEFFNLSDMAVMPSPNPANQNNLPRLIPAHTHSPAAAFYLLKILNETQETVNEIIGLEISGDVSNGLKGLLESVRWRFVDILITASSRGAHHSLSHWSLVDPSYAQRKISTVRTNLL